MTGYCRNGCGVLVFFVLHTITTDTGEQIKKWRCMNAEDGTKHRCLKWSPAMSRMEQYFKNRWMDFSFSALKPLPDGPPEEEEEPQV
jgi:hypothetical protein